MGWRVEVSVVAGLELVGRDVAEREQLRRFLLWLTGKASQAELGVSSGRTFRRQTAWCWLLQPRMPVTGEVHDAVLVDGVWIGSWCLLIAQSSTGTVIAWQWAARETTAAWEALFAQIPPPRVVVTDGGSGIRSALARTWPDTAIQRCIFHLHLNITRELTRSPRLKAGRALRQIAWFLLLHEIPLEHAHKHASIPEPAPVARNEEPIGPALYDTGLTADEGLWTRSGWAGRT